MHAWHACTHAAWGVGAVGWVRYVLLSGPGAWRNLGVESRGVGGQRRARGGYVVSDDRGKGVRHLVAGAALNPQTESPICLEWGDPTRLILSGGFALGESPLFSV